jgi:hypothetical protein
VVEGRGIIRIFGSLERQHAIAIISEALVVWSEWPVINGSNIRTDVDSFKHDRVLSRAGPRLSHEHLYDGQDERNVLCATKNTHEDD